MHSTGAADLERGRDRETGEPGRRDRGQRAAGRRSRIRIGPSRPGADTGFIIDEVGHIVTNWHVVNGGDQFEVIFADGEKRPVELEGADRLSDLAVVRVDGPLPAIVPFGNSDVLEPGLPVLAIGSPLGTFTNTVTDGIISGLGTGPAGFTDSGAAGLQQFDSA